MNTQASTMMTTRFTAVRPDAPVREAVRLIAEGRVRGTGYKPSGILVVDDVDRLVGMISMFDILYHLRPSFMNYQVDAFEMWQGELEPYLAQFQDLKVEEIMTAPVQTAAADDHLMVLIDRMVKEKVRRLPVIEDGKILGVVYLSDVFTHLCRSWLNPE